MPNKIHVATIGKPHGIKGAMSIIAKTRPQSLIFEHPLFLEDETPFKVSDFETHHTKVVCFSPSAPDRNHAEKMRLAKLYCETEALFKLHPEQIFDDLCHGYQILGRDNQLLGTLEHVEFINNIPFLILTHNEQTLHLPADIHDINHSAKTLQLTYQPS